jgi:hypothetical protein
MTSAELFYTPEFDVKYEAYLPHVSLYEYSKIFSRYSLGHKIQCLESRRVSGHSNSLDRDPNSFALDNQEFGVYDESTFNDRDFRYRRKISSYLEHEVSREFILDVSGYMASSDKPDEAIEDIYDEFMLIHDEFQGLDDLDILEFLLFYRNYRNRTNIEEKIDLYSRQKGEMGSLITDSILKHIILAQGLRTIKNDQLIKIKDDIEGLADVYPTTPLYLISAFAIYGKHPYSELPLYYVVGGID